MLKTGTTGVRQDTERAAALLQQACDDEFRNGCFNLSIMHLTGVAGKFAVDKPKALEFAARACRLGHTYGCVNAARMCALGKVPDLVSRPLLPSLHPLPVCPR